MEVEDDHELEVSQKHQLARDELPWVEKYRPNSLDDVAHQEDVVATLKRTLETANLPHLLFYGPPGTGKTSTILAVAKELYGPTLVKKRVLELNASNERGIDVIRHKVKQFAQIAVGTADNVEGYPCPPYKIIILDEADSMTRDAQSALRRTMELYTKVTRFCIICNYVSRIIDPITSRCAKFRFRSLSKKAMIDRLSFIADKEHVTLPPAAADAVVEAAVGDMRKSITLIQSANRMVDEKEEITKDLIETVAGRIPDELVASLFKACYSNDCDTIERATNSIIADGYPGDRVLVQLQECVVEANDLSDKQKGMMCVKMGEVDYKLTEGGDEYLQLLDMFLTFRTIIQQHGNK